MLFQSPKRKGAKRAAFSRRNGFEGLETRRMMAAHIVGNPTAYATIQAAVDAALPGMTINVDAGTYSEQVYVDKTLTLRGAQAGNDARSNVRSVAAETILNGALLSDGTRTSCFYIGANDVTIDGFSIQGQTTQGDAGAGAVIAPGRFGTHFINNIVQNNVAGLFLSNTSTTDPTIIQYNLFRNNNNDGSNGGRAIYSNGGISGGNLVNVLIDSNAFVNNYGGLNTTRVEAAIALESRTLNTQHDVRITNNVFDGDGKSVLVYNADHILIQGNVVTAMRDQWSAAFRFEGGGSFVTIKNNTAYDNTGPVVRVDEKGFSGSNNNFVVTDNNFSNNSTAYTNKQSVILSALGQYDGTLIATNNWWNSATGPSGDGPGTGDAIVLSGNAGIFSPWATSLIGTGRAPFLGLAQSTNALIQLEDFDQGGEGIAYHDSDSGNLGGQYRKGSTRVDIGTTSDAGGGYMLTSVKGGEWLKYTVNVEQPGTYNLDFRLASGGNSGTFHLMIDGVNATGPITVPNTGGSQNFTTITRTGLVLAAGLHDMQLVMDTAGTSGIVASFNWMRLTNTTPLPVPIAPDGLIASASGFAAVSLQWYDNSSDETGFVIERRPLPSGVWQQVGTAAANSITFTDGTVSGGTTYSYRVRAFSALGQSANSNEVAVTTPPAQAVTYLSDLPFSGTPINGWGPIERDQSVGGPNLNDGLTIKLNGVTYAKGLGTNAISDVSFALGGAYGTFQSDVGVDDKQLYDGTVIFQVFADGVKIYDSGVMTPDSATQSLNLNIAGVQQLRLHVDDAGDGPDFDHADWAGARLLVGAPPVTQPVPAAPSGLTAATISATQINLAWTDVANETGYTIERSLDGVSFAVVGTAGADATSYSDATGLAGGTKYYYRVLATNATGSSLPSNVVSATTPALPTPPAAPSGLLAAALSPSRIDLSWTDNSIDETGFILERSPDGLSWTQIATPAANATSYSDVTGLSGLTTYFYRVSATNAVGPSAVSNVSSATTPAVPTAPAAPTSLAASTVLYSQINLTWTDNSSNEANFVLERSLDGISGWTQIATPAMNATSYSDTGLSAATMYFYRVRAMNAVGASADSNIASAATLAAPTVPNAPTNVLASGVSSSQINLSWTDVSTNETGFVVERSLDGATGWSQIATPAANATSYSDSIGLSASTKYFYRVRAVNAVGPSANSNVASATTLAPTLPTGWSNTDIGSVGKAGTASYTAGAYTVSGAGTGIGGHADSFNFSCQSLSGNGSITARVASNSGVAGIMLRDGLGANARMVALVVNPDGSVTFSRRSSVGGNTETTNKSRVSGPQWLRLVRSGNNFTAYRSTNGSQWTLIGSDKVTMSTNVYAGLAVTSMSLSSKAAATIDNVSVILG